MRRLPAKRALGLVALAWAIAAAAPQSAERASSTTPTIRRFSGMQQSSHYVPMRDGVKLAVDVHLPKGLAPGERTATILHLSRYYRSLNIKGMWRPFFGAGYYTVTERDTRERMVEAGYSWVDVDVRGTGASFGRWEQPLSPEEVRDGADVMDWIVKQPWSAGIIGVTGGSYSASLAVMQLANAHPALKAVVTRFGAWDMYDDVFNPGGLQAVSFRSQYSSLLAAFDSGRLGDVFGWAAGGMVRGVRPVKDDLLGQAQRERANNTNLDRLLRPVFFRDDSLWPGKKWTMDDFSPHVVVGARSSVPILTVSGWFDGAMSKGQLRQFAATRTPGSRLRMGPWFHASFSNASPYVTRDEEYESAVEMQRFFDHHLRGIDTGIADEKPIHYFTMGAEQWRTTDAWPPPNVEWQSLYFNSEKQLTSSPSSSAEADDRYDVDFSTASGAARWGVVAGTGRSRKYEDRRDRSSRLLAYTSAPLHAPLEVTGHPRVEIHLSANADDGGLFVYLEDVAPDGRVRYVTEGQLRIAHRDQPRSFKRAAARPLATGAVEAVVYELLPTSYRFPSGHSIRIAIAGADAGTFTLPKMVPGLVYNIHRDAVHRSRVMLPAYPFP